MSADVDRFLKMSGKAPTLTSRTQQAARPGQTVCSCRDVPTATHTFLTGKIQAKMFTGFRITMTDVLVTDVGDLKRSRTLS